MAARAGNRIFFIVVSDFQWFCNKVILISSDDAYLDELSDERIRIDITHDRRIISYKNLAIHFRTFKLASADKDSVRIVVYNDIDLGTDAGLVECHRYLALESHKLIKTFLLHFSRGSVIEVLGSICAFFL